MPRLNYKKMVERIIKDKEKGKTIQEIAKWLLRKVNHQFKKKKKPA